MPQPLQNGVEAFAIIEAQVHCRQYHLNQQTFFADMLSYSTICTLFTTALLLLNADMICEHECSPANTWLNCCLLVCLLPGSFPAV